MVFVHLADGFEEIEALTTVDLLRRVGVPTALVSVTGKRYVSGAHDIIVKADYIFEECDYQQCDMLVLPGGMPGTLGLAEHLGLCNELKGFAEQGKKIAAICAAPMVLGKLGILDGKEAVIYPGMEQNLIGSIVGSDRIVKSGNIITAKGPGVAMEFALAIVAEFCAPETVAELREELIL